MFKHLSFFVCLLGTSAVMASVEPATKYVVGGIRYALDGKKAVVWPLSDDSSDYYSGDVVVPEMVSINGNDYPVVGINRHAFSDCDNLSSVTLPQSIEWLAEGCFAYSKNLASISFNNGNKRYEVKNGIVYTIPAGSMFTLDFTNQNRSYNTDTNESNLHYPQYSGPISLDVDETDGNGADYFSWTDGSGVEHKVLRIYRDYNFTISSQSGAITKIKFFIDGRQGLTVDGTELEGNTWTGRTYALTFGSTRRNNIDSIQVTIEKPASQAFAAPMNRPVTVVDSVCALAQEAFANNVAESITIPASVDFVGYNSLSIPTLHKLHLLGSVPSYRENPFVSTDKTSCRLIVRKQYLEDYKNDSLWGRFKLIETETTDNIGNVVALPSEASHSYNLQGQTVATGFRGIVIVGRKKVIR